MDDENFPKAYKMINNRDVYFYERDIMDYQEYRISQSR